MKILGFYLIQILQKNKIYILYTLYCPPKATSIAYFDGKG